MLFYVFTLLFFPDMFPATPKTLFLVPGMPIFISGTYHPWLPAYRLWNMSAALVCWLFPLEICLSLCVRLPIVSFDITVSSRDTCVMLARHHVYLSASCRLPPLRHLLIPDLSSDISEILRVPALSSVTPDVFSCHWLVTFTSLIFPSLSPVTLGRFAFPFSVVFPAWHIISCLTCRLPCLFACRLSFAIKDMHAYLRFVSCSSWYAFSCLFVPGLSPANLDMLLVFSHSFSRPWPFACYPWYAYASGSCSLSFQAYSPLPFLSSAVLDMSKYQWQVCYQRLRVLIPGASPVTPAVFSCPWFVVYGSFVRICQSWYFCHLIYGPADLISCLQTVMGIHVIAVRTDTSCRIIGFRFVWWHQASLYVRELVGQVLFVR